MKSFILTIIISMLFASNMLASGMERLRVIWNGDPSTTATIAFEGESRYNYELHYGTVSGGATRGNYQVVDKTPDNTVNVNGGTALMYNVFFRLNNLQPNTRYYFYVWAKSRSWPLYREYELEYNNIKEFYFETAPNNPNERLSLIFGGDSRVSTIDEINARNAANQLVAKLRPHAVVFGGDYTLLDTFGEWKNWLNNWQRTIASDGRVTPIIPAKGNHEYEKDILQEMFDMPNDNYYYALNIGGNLLRLYTLNNGNDSHTAVTGTQTTWLANDISTNCATWKIAQYHKPMRPHHAAKSERNNERASWAPEFEDHKLQLAVESDAHLFKYTYPIASKNCAAQGGNCVEGFYPDAQNGVAYIGEGGWGADLRDANDAKTWTASSAKFNQFKWLWIDQNKIEIRTIQTYLPSSNTDLSAAVTALNANNRFTIPSGLTVYNTGLNTNTSTYSIIKTVYTLKNPNNVSLPTITLAPGDVLELADGQSKTLDAGAGYMSYAWSTGATSQTINVSQAGSYQVTCTAWSGCTTTGKVTRSVPLPVELLSFTGKGQTGANYLTWATASEWNSSHFVVEASENGQNFHRIGQRQANGNTSQKTVYDFYDYKVISSSTYYRLKIVDTDGSFEYSNIVEIQNDAAEDWNIVVAPVPAYDAISVSLGKGYKGMNVKYAITGNSGKVFLQGNWENNGTQLELNISQFTRGVYYCSIVDQKGIKRVQRFIKL